MKIKKTILVAMASAMILGLGTNLQSLPTASARHVRTYRYHRIRSRRARRGHRTKRVKRTKRTKRTARKRSTKRRYRFNKHSRRYVRTDRRHRTRRYRFTHKLRHYRYQRVHAKLHVRKYHYRTRRHAKRHASRHQARTNYNTQPANTGTSDITPTNNQVNQSTQSSTTQPKSNYDIGVDKITKYLMDQSQGEASEADAKSDAEGYMNGETNESTGDPTIDAILEQYQSPDKRGNTSTPDTQDPNLPIAKQDSFDKATEARTIYDLQQDRASLGEGPLTVSPALTHLAEERAPQLEQNFSHYDSNMNDYDEMDDPENKANETGENISGDPAEYSPKAEADGMNDGLFYDERPTQENPYGGGHYQAIKYSTSVGVGYENGFLAEEFNDANL